tara:strand:- start:220 stop:477 length:258 start_codon:yes stop_codon:yes gene_type:complete
MNLRENYVDGVSQPIEFDWEMIRQDRQFLLETSDMYMLVDRYNTLTTEQQNELARFRELLRNITVDYSTANEAAENFPDPPAWLL